jgi:hypothetical protein
MCPCILEVGGITLEGLEELLGLPRTLWVFGFKHQQQCSVANACFSSIILLKFIVL